MPSASNLDQKPPAETPRYKHVTTPLDSSSSGAMTSRKQFGLITMYGELARGAIFVSANTFALGYSGSPESTTLLLTCGYFRCSASTIFNAGSLESRAPKMSSKSG
jgi:hypothetical protein